MKLCITTVVSANHFQYYIPLFIYPLNKYYPQVDIKISVMGRLKADVKDALKHCFNYEIKEDQFLNYPKRASTCNSLRFLQSERQFLEYDYLYVTDVDFIHFSNSLFPEYIKEIKNTGKPYAASGGAKKSPVRKEIAPGGWRNDFKRVACGYVMLKIPKWFKKTSAARKKYKELVKSGKHDSFDKHPSCSYREYDEVMFARICKLSGLKIPTRKRIFLSGTPINPRYRNVHLGDFKHDVRGDIKKMRKRITDSNIKNFEKLEKDLKWQKICEIVEGKEQIHVILKRLRKHVKRRKKFLK